jgi:hypothetical protein
VILKLSPDEVRSIRIQHVPRRPLGAEYLEERERAWNERMSHARGHGKKLWNGTIYTVEKFLQFDESRILLELGTCEYKDIVFQNRMGAEALAERFGSAHLFSYTVADCIPITTDGKAVFGIRAAGTNIEEGAIGLIGGTLNQDERQISSLQDLTDYMKKEIDEETALPLGVPELRLYAINYYRSKFEFLYTARLAFGSAEISAFERQGEFSRLVALNALELAEVKNNRLDAVRFCARYLPELLS